MTDTPKQDEVSVDDRIAQVAFNADGLAPIIVQQWDSREVLMLIQVVREARLDCDGDALLLLVDQTGPACHTGTRTCFDTTDLDAVDGVSAS